MAATEDIRASSETLLKIEEREFLASRIGNEFPVEHHVVLKGTARLKDLGKLAAQRAQISREQFGTPVHTMELGTNAIELVFQPDLVAFAA